MAFELKDGQGSIFPNDYKNSESQPDFKGKLKINGEEYEVAAWEQTTRKGATFYSLRVKLSSEESRSTTSSNKPRPAQQQTRPARQESGTPMNKIQGMDDDIPF